MAHHGGHDGKKQHGMGGNAPHHSGHEGRKEHEPHKLHHKGMHKKESGFMTSPAHKNLGKG